MYLKKLLYHSYRAASIIIGGDNAHRALIFEGDQYSSSLWCSSASPPGHDKDSVGLSRQSFARQPGLNSFAAQGSPAFLDYQ
jgi:hypothetical protein